MSMTVVASDNSQYPWLGDDAVGIVSKSGISSERLGCTTRTVKASFYNGFEALGCVYGDDTNTRIVVYTDQGGMQAIAIAYPGDLKYSEVMGVCRQGRACAYSSTRDTLIDSETGRFYQRFAENLTRKTSPVSGVGEFHFTRLDTGRPLNPSSPIAFNALSVSSNGQWAIVEAYEYGFVRIDLDSFHERRVAISGARYGVANDPRFNIAVSNSGRDVIVAGDRSGVSLYQVDPYCGDVLTRSSMYYFQSPTVPCRQSSSVSTALFPNMISSYNPTFNDRGDRLALSVYATSGNQRVVLAPRVTIPGKGVAYIALGDSFTSGEGETRDDYYLAGTDVEQNKCHVSGRSYAFLLAPKWRIDKSRNVACSGAKTTDIIGEGSYNGKQGVASGTALELFTPGIVRQIRFVEKYQPDRITLGIGGNDAGLMGKLNSCIGPGVCEWARQPEKRFASALEIQALLPRIRGVISAIRNISPASKVALIGYPRIINEEKDAKCPVSIASLLAPQERMFMDASIKVLNDTLRAAASSEHIPFVNVQNAFNGHRLCDVSSAAMNGVRLGNDIAPIKGLSMIKIIGAESFHPTPFGHTLVADIIASDFPVDSNTCSQCDTGGVIAPLDAFWMTGSSAPPSFRLMNGIIVKNDEIKNSDPIEIAHTDGIFQALSKAIIRLDWGDGEERIENVVVDEQGRFSTKLEPLKNEHGQFVTVTVQGDSRSGEKIHLYQTIKVAGIYDEADNVIESQGSNRKEEPEKQPQGGTVAHLGQPLAGMRGVGEIGTTVANHGDVGGSHVSTTAQLPSLNFQKNSETQGVNSAKHQNAAGQYWAFLFVGVIVVGSVGWVTYTRYRTRQ